MDQETIKNQGAPQGGESDSAQKPQDQPNPKVSAASSGAIAPNERKPIEAVLYDCRRTFYFAFGLTVLIDFLTIVPLLYMMNIMDRVISARSGVTLVSLTLLVVALYIFWSAIEWIRKRILVRLSLRLDWDLSADIFDASFTFLKRKYHEYNRKRCVLKRSLQTNIKLKF